MQVCTLLQTDNHTSTPPLCFLQPGCPSWCPTNSIKALKATKHMYNMLLNVYHRRPQVEIAISQLGSSADYKTPVTVIVDSFEVYWWVMIDGMPGVVNRYWSISWKLSGMSCHQLTSPTSLTEHMVLLVLILLLFALKVKFIVFLSKVILILKAEFVC